MLKKLRSHLVHSKVLIHRALSWISVINAGMILFLVLSQLEKYGINLRITKWYLPLLIVTFFLMIFFGYIEDRLGFTEEEAAVTTSKNPYIRDIVNRLERIENHLQNMEKTGKR